MKAFRALLLVLALSVCTYADGNMPNEKNGNMPNERVGEIHNPKADAANILLNLLHSVLPLF